ncbi:MAG TPA: multicopper oxidase domain-containing protein, partial [Flavobacterium sp.]|nr:multicopper oxidase domain-containing protein [Flavobacterium sp.]
MKKIILIMMLSLGVVSAFGQHQEHEHDKTGSIAFQQDNYTCPMHPEVQSPKPGNCPKCGMKLVKQQVKAAKKPAPKATKPAAKVPAKPKVPAVKAAPVKKQEVAKPATKPTAESSGHAPEKPGTTYKPKRVRYDLFVRDTMVHYTGKHRMAIAINGSIPAPTLTFTEGDTAEVHVHNMMEKETSIHWHGVFLPNQYDGVPYLTQMPIAPRSTFVYKFPVIQNGTYWYHSHTGLQEQIGMYGALIFKKPNEPEIPVIPVVISEWIDMMPMEVERRLHTASDYFGIQKNTVQSYTEAIKAGHLKTKVNNEWKRMNAMDVSDVAYDAFLVNGATEKQYPKFKAGDKVKLRIVNGGASSYFWLTYSGGKITVVANDGNDVEPVEVDRLIIATAETYDVIVTIPEDMSYEFLVTPEDRTKSASLWLGDGMKMPAEKLPRLKYFSGMKMMNEMMDMNGDMKPMGMVMTNQTMDMNSVMYPEITGPENGESEAAEPEQSTPVIEGHEGHNMATMSSDQDIVTLNYGMLRATEKTTLPDKPFRELHFELTGNMNRYVWTLNNKTVSESDKILIKKGENIRITMYNNSMMRHPMHLHGHDFRVINGQGDYAPMKNTIDVMPMETDTIEFAATESGDWFFHCHILYHMMSGMGRIFSYENSPPNPFIANPKAAYRTLMSDDRMFHFMFANDFATNGNDGMAMYSNTRWQISSEWRLGYNSMHGYEVETHVGRYFGQNQWLMPFVGFDWRYRQMGSDEHEENLFGQVNSKDRRAEFSAGVEYILPMLVKASAEVYTDGNFRLTLRREDIPITRQLRMNMMVNSDKEYMAGFRYALGKYFSPSVHYDSDMGLGV